MKYKWYMHALAILFLVSLLVSCKSVADTKKVNSDTDTSIANQDIIISEDSSEALFMLGMQKDSIYKLLQSLDIELTLDESHGNAGSSIHSKELRLFFSPDNQLIEIYLNASNSKYKTAKGLQFGDELGKVLKLYGDQFVTHEEPDVIVYEYKIDDQYFSIGIDANNKVTGWGISKDSAFYKQ